MRKLASKILAAAALFFGAAGAEGASITVFTDAPAWVSTVGINLSVENFDQLGAFRTGDTIILDGVTYRTGADAGGVHPGLGVFDGGSAYVGSSPPLVFAPVETVAYELQFRGGSVAALGFFEVVPTSASVGSPVTDRITAVGSDGVVTTFDQTFTAGGPHFLGFTGSVVQVVIAPLANGSGTTSLVAIDDVMHSPVIGGGFPVASIGAPTMPEPASVVMLGIGLLAVGGIAWRQ